MVVAVKVFKKTTPNGKLTFYLGKRDFIDHLDYCDPIDGVVVVDSDYLKGRKVFGELITVCFNLEFFLLLYCLHFNYVLTLNQMFCFTP